MSVRPPLLLVVSTLGRVEALRDLLRSVAAQLDVGDRVTIVAQDRQSEVAELVEQLRPDFRADVHVTTSARGASLGRNTGVSASAPSPDTIVMFPNDTTWFPAGSIETIAHAIGRRRAGAVAVMTPSGPRFTLPPPGTPLDTATVWNVIEMGLVIKAELFQALGGFDTSIGTGAGTPWQAGEVTDLLLRALTAEQSLGEQFAWIDDAWVGGIEEGTGLTADERAWKLRAYGRGIGYVYRIHRYPLWRRIGFTVAGLAIGIRRRREYRLRDGWPAFVGRVEGITARVLRERRAPHAVSR